MVHICIHIVAGIAFLTLVVMQFSQQAATKVLRDWMVATAQSMQANQTVVAERFLTLEDQTLTLGELEYLSDNMANIYDDLISIREVLKQCAPSEKSERKQMNLMAVCYDFYRFTSYVLPTAQSDKVHDDVLTLTPTDRSKLKLIANVYKIMNEVSKEFTVKESQSLRVALMNRETCINRQHEAISDYLEKNFAFEMLASHSLGDSILEMLFD